MEHDSNVDYPGHDGQKYSGVLDTFRYRALVVKKELLCIQADLDPIVYQNEEWSRWESHREHGEETELDYWERRQREREGERAGESIRIFHSLCNQSFI